MNTFLKLFIVLTLGFLVTVPLLAKNKQNTTQPIMEAQEGPAPQESTPPPRPAPIAPPQKPIMTQALKNRIRTGMTLEQCVLIIGCPGEKTKPMQGMDEAYRWYDPNGRSQYTLSFRNGLMMGSGSSSTASQNKKVAQMRAQYKPISLQQAAQLEAQARRAGQRIVVSIDAYQRIQPGMTYDQCVQIIGSDTPMGRAYAAQRNAAMNDPKQNLDEGYQWRNPGGYFAEITFHNGRVTGKTWKQGPGGGGGRASGSSGGS